MNVKRLVPLICIAIFVYILSTLNLGGILKVFSALNPWYVLLSVCSLIPIILLVNVEWQLILKKHGIRVSFGYSLKNIFIGYFYGFITPGGFGGYARALYLKDKSKASLQKCVVDLLLFNTVDYVAFLCLGLLGGLILSGKAPVLFPVFLLLFILVVVVSFVLIRKETGKRVFQRLLKARLLSTLKDKWGGHIETLYDEMPRSRYLILPFMVSIVGWMLWFSILFFISSLFSISVPNFLLFFAIVATANVIASIPVSIYGLGTREAALIALFGLFGVTQESVIAFSLFWFVLSWLIPGIIGAGITVWESRHRKSLEKKITSKTKKKKKPVGKN